jgi:hypothetical protein
MPQTHTQSGIQGPTLLEDGVDGNQESEKGTDSPLTT